jgi:hypothetical protein
MTLHRTTGHTTGATTRGARSNRNTFTHTIRTGTVLRAASGLLATAVLALPASSGFSREAVGTSAVEPFAGTSPPGAIGARGRLQPGSCPDGYPRSEAALPDFIQPVDIRGPAGMRIAIETADGWTSLKPGPLRMGLVVGRAYRLRITGVGIDEGSELFPSVRVLAKLAAPPGMAWRFPVEIVIDEADLSMALEGSLVRRVVYAACDPEQPDLLPSSWFDVRPGDDAYAVASTLGDPVAELIIGNRVPAPGSMP